jgi:DNA-binding transcriptional regulator YiaG
MIRKSYHYKMCGLEYVYLENAPLRRTRFGEILVTDLAVIEAAIAKEIIKKGIPLRGLEVRFLRKCLGLSLTGLGQMLGLSAPAILKWEKAGKKRLLPVNEIAVRALVAEKLKVSVSGEFTALRGLPEAPARLLLRVA